MNHPDHDHDHPHDHATADPGAGTAEQIPESSEVGSVVIDIGGSVGAATVTTPASFTGKEIEIRPEDGEWDGTHVAVIPRHLGTGTIHAALFPSLTAGAYRVRVRFGAVAEGVEVPFEVAGGVVTRVAWPES